MNAPAQPPARMKTAPLYYQVTLADGRNFWILDRGQADRLAARNPGAAISGPKPFDGLLPECLRK